MMQNREHAGRSTLVPQNRLKKLEKVTNVRQEAGIVACGAVSRSRVLEAAGPLVGFPPGTFLGRISMQLTAIGTDCAISDDRPG